MHAQIEQVFNLKGDLMDIENFELQDYDEDELAAKREAQLQADEESVARPDDNDCGGACSI